MPRLKQIDINLNGLSKLLGAEVYQESSGFICLLPDDVHESVTGRGDSVAEAVNAWDVNLKAHLRNASEDDPIVQYVKSIIAKPGQGEDVSSVVKGKVKVDIEKTREQNMQDFEAQFYPSLKQKK
ncbi:hypothetical protein ACJVDH_00330 [Pedobacter sp. AW1-32]|uniref:hypothetical protein n=1 Tax=Pedobacter sp. AW1-32 TaxID=3383026 RepID=UPI003FF05C77